jgi:hypothetical protein
MTTPTYDYGESVTLTVEFLDDVGAPADPSTVKLLLTKPDGTSLTEITASSPYTPTYAHPSVGNFEYTFDPDMAGTWVGKWTGANTHKVVEEYYFVVKANGKSGWSYSGDPSLSKKDEVRFLVGDTNPADPMLSDTEINYLVAQCGNPWLAAIRGCQVGAMKYGRLLTQTVGPFSIEYGQKQAQLLSLAEQLTSAYNQQGGAGSPTWTEPALGPLFAVGMDDNHWVWGGWSDASV